MRAREKMLATSRASAAAPASFEDTLSQVSMKTQQRHAQARSLEPLPRSSVCRGIEQDLPHGISVISNEISYQQQKSMFERLDSHTTTAESDDDVPEGIPIKLQKSTIAENGDYRGKRRGGAAKKEAHEKHSDGLQPTVQRIASTKLLDVNEPPRTQVQEEGYVERHEGQAVIGELMAPKGQRTKQVAQGSSTDAPQQADIVSLDMLSLDQSAAAEIRRQVLGFGCRLEFRV